MGNKSPHLHTPSNMGELPSGWVWRRLDEVSDLIVDCPHSTPQLTEEGFYVARSQDIRSGVFRTDQAARVSENTYIERIVRAEPSYGDLLYSREGTYFGIAAEVPRDVKLCLGQRMVLIRPTDKKVNFRFLRFWLNSPIMAGHLNGFRDGSVAERLNMPTIRTLSVILPPLQEQEAIADILGSLDDKIEVNRKMNETLESMARAIFKSWFIDFAPVHAKLKGQKPEGMDAETAKLFPSSFQESEMGRIPKGWKVGSLGETHNLTMGQSPAGSTYNENGDGLPFYQGRRDFGFRYPVLRIHCNASTRIAQQGDTLVSVRAPVGDINMASAKCCIGRGVAAVRHQSGSRSFTYYSIQGLQPSLQQFEGNGTVFGSINKDQFERLVVVAPTDDAVRVFENAVFSMDDKIEILTKEMNALSVTRDALLPRLLSGELMSKPEGVWL